jgi:hypothetical protein
VLTGCGADKVGSIGSRRGWALCLAGAGMDAATCFAATGGGELGLRFAAAAFGNAGAVGAAGATAGAVGAGGGTLTTTLAGAMLPVKFAGCNNSSRRFRSKSNACDVATSVADIDGGPELPVAVPMHVATAGADPMLFSDKAIIAM